MRRSCEHRFTDAEGCNGFPLLVYVLDDGSFFDEETIFSTLPIKRVGIVTALALLKIGKSFQSTLLTVLRLHLEFNFR